MAERREIAVHPNSMAARKWGRSTWSTTTEPARAPGDSRVARDRDSFFRLAAAAARRGDNASASRLRAAAMRARQTSITCG